MLGLADSESGSKMDKDDDLPAEYVNSPLAKESQTPDRDRQKELELQEKEELDLALALSASEAEAQRHKNAIHPPPSPFRTDQQPHARKTTGSTPASQSQPPVSTAPRHYSQLDTSEMDPELARYLNRNYWEKKANMASERVASPVPSVASSIAQQPSAPPAAFSPDGSTMGSEANSLPPPQSNGPFGVTEEVDRNQEDFLNALRSSIDIFVNRMRSNSIRGRSIANDSSVQTLFLTLNAMHPQLLQFINHQEEARTQFETLQDKLAQLKDAREALNALRDEHSERRRREAEEVARQRQIQMRQKLEVMRQKKQELLEYQRQMALQRLHEQEMERLQRLEQEKQMLQMRQYQQQFPYTYAQQHQQHPQQHPQQPQPQNVYPTGSQQYPPPGPQPMYQGMYGGQDVPGAPVGSGPPMAAPQEFSMPSHSSMPPPQQQPVGGYTMSPPQGAVDYNQSPYNMQGMNQTLPAEYGATPSGAPQQPMMAGPYSGGPTGPYAPGQAPPMPPQGGQQPPPGSGRPNDQLINFD